ncbi:hypothetical protein GTA08_BOTSDO07197 [Botryosphaeria dothidea]|uniref:Pentatricopeptide repeat protein n=1 Tax=Botryosphaeria dothidea TaxID=55169 RepID=A0A8H4N4U2_9PEZI|nr:hypothetical protein GTA08_BOTSDO07197 [Botryosphaeria dothidea]
MVFYDRMIERYAAVHDTGKMTTFLTHMSKQGLTPGWPALQAVVVKLADIGDWERFDEIVNDVQTGSGIARRGLRKSDENVIDRFWSNDSGVSSGVKFVTSTIGNTVGGLTNTVGGVVGAAGRGIGETLEGATGSAGRPVARGVADAATGVEDGSNRIAKGVKDAGQGK